MKKFKPALFFVAVLAIAFALIKPGIVDAAALISDSFADGNSTVQNLANQSIRIFKGRAATTRTDAVGSVAFDMTATGGNSEAFWGFFTNSGAPVNLGVGDKLSVAGTFSVTGLVGTGQDIRFGVLNSQGTRNANDLTGGMNDATFAGDPGYALGFFPSGTGSPFTIYRRTNLNVNNVFNTFGDFTALSGTGATARQQIVNNTPYTLSYTIERLSATDTKISVSVTGGALNNLNFTATESSVSPNTAFDYFAFRVGGANFAQKVTFTNWTIDYTPSLPVITAQPQPSNLTVQVGSNVTTSVAATGSALSYQWHKNGAPLAGNPSAATQTLNLTNVQLADAGSYTAVVSNPGGSVTSDPVTLNVSVDPVPPPPSITAQPSDITPTVGTPAALSVAATGENLFYQWFKNGALIPGANQAALNFAAAQTSDSGIYTIVVSNSSGSVSSAPARVLVVSAMQATAFAPANFASETDIDAPLYLSFNQAPRVGNSGRLSVYRADGTLVDTIDMSLAQQSRQNGTVTFNYRPIIVAGNTAAVYLHQKLAYNQSYYVTIEPGVLTDASGAPFTGFSDPAVWNFSTKTSGPAANATFLTVAADGSGDFATVQGAVDFVPANNNKRVVIFVKKGTYTEIVYVGSNKPFITVRGEDRHQSVIQYANNNSFNPTSTTHRTMFGVDAADFTLENITLRNTTPQGGSQAEAFRGNNNRIVLNRVSLYSFQDTLLLQGQSNQGGFVTDSYIEGDVDFMWGSGAVFFQNTELKMLRSDAFYTQIRNGAGRNGYVYVNCKFTRGAGINNSYLTRIDPDDFPFSQVVVINSRMDGVRADPWQFNNPSLAVTAANYPNIRFWEYNSRDLLGNPVDTSLRHPISRQLTAAEALQWSDPAFVLGGWSPQTKLTAAVSLSNLTQGYNGQPLPVTVTTEPAGLPVEVTYSGSPTPPSALGTYSVVATINDPNYQGSATGTLTIERPTVAITLSNLTHAFDGTPKTATVSTTPAGVPVTVTYNNSTTAPTAVGTYSVVATTSDSNYRGGTSATMTIYAPGAQPLAAFPGAEGAGAYAKGGRGGDVYRVTNLNDAGAGSLREGIRTATGPRTIVFDVSGTINLRSRLNINKSFLTIAGQTAPGDGVTLAGFPAVVNNANNVVVRYLRVRLGDQNCPVVQDDAFWVDNSTDVILDHVSASWSVDETLSVSDSNRVTVQWSFITESMRNSCHIKGAHGYGSLIRGAAGGLVTYHHNLYAHHDSRNPRLGDSVGLDFVNNVVYNWGGQAGYSGPAEEGTPRLNYVGNYLIAGISTNVSARNRAFLGGSPNTQIYQSNNLIDGDLDSTRDGANTDWAMFQGTYTRREPARFDFPQIQTDDAQTAYERVLEGAGSALKRDAVDERLVTEVRTGTGRHINSQTDVGGFPPLTSLNPQPDTDGDGMSDEWEYAHNLNPADAADGRLVTASGYTNLEIYLNKLTPVPFNYAPSAAGDAAETNEDGAVAVDVLSNDTDIDGDALTIIGATPGAHGAVEVSGSQVTYTPNPNFFGADSFTYSVTDGAGNTATATVSVSVNPVNDAPVLTNVPATLTGNELTPFAFTASASDVDSPLLTFSLANAPNGAAIDAATGQFTWTPDESQGGTGAPFVLRVVVSDDEAQAESEISVTVGEVNAAPTLAAIDAQTVFLGSTLTFNASGADADVPAQNLSYSLTGNVPAGAAIDAATGAFAWTPSKAQAGAIYNFNVRVGDGALYAERAVTVGVAYEWSDLLAPFSAGGSFVFNQGAIIPVKFKLTGASAPVTNATARLWLAKIVNGEAQAEFPATAIGGTNAGNLFRYDAVEGQYIFNLSTRNLPAGVYRLRIELGDGVSRTVEIALQ